MDNYTKRIEKLNVRLVGKTLEEAERELKQDGLILRETIKDEELCLGLSDIRPNRINVKTKDGKIVKVMDIQ